MTEKKKNNIIIGTLCAIILLMAAGYAAFSTVLNINGEANITSKWNIHFDSTKTTETTGVIVGTTGITNGTVPTGTVGYTDENLTANLTADLKQPGDKVVYNLSVMNEGTLNAKLNKITVTEPNNPVIKLSLDGIKEGDPLDAGASKPLIVTIEYDSSVTEQPESTTADLTVKLDFVQNVNGGGSAVTPPTSNLEKYRFNMDTINPGDSIDLVSGATDDYTTLGHNVFLKHIIVDDKVDSTEACFIKDGLHCLKQEPFETTKTTLVNIFGADKCEIDDTKARCKGDVVSVLATPEGDIMVYSDTEDCDLNSDGSSQCFG